MQTNTPNCDLWFSSCTKNVSHLAEVIYSIQKSNLCVEALHLEDTPNGPGILFFDKNSCLEELIEHLTNLVQLSNSKVLTISLDTIPTGWGWQLLNAGAADLMTWSGVENPIPVIKAKIKRWHESEELLNYLQKVLVGRSQAWIKTLKQIVEIVFTNSPILILGESGTGKELVSKEIHHLDRRPNKKDFVIVDCTNIAPGLSGSELFGHEKGSFTGAMSSRDGAIALANEGTLFLDELGELPIGQQAEFLRVLQEGTYKRVGGNHWNKVNFRLISATNRNLLEEVKKNNFRQDLYYRVSGWVCRLP